MKLLIFGSRSFNDYNFLKKEVDAFIQENNFAIVEIISGGAQGADKLGERYACVNEYNVIKHLANWDEHGKSAGYIRNEIMAKECDCAIGFWDGKSKGTLHAIKLLRKDDNKLLKIISIGSR